MHIEKCQITTTETRTRQMWHAHGQQSLEKGNVFCLYDSATKGTPVTLTYPAPVQVEGVRVEMSDAEADAVIRGDVDERSICDVQGSDLNGYTQVHFFAGIGGWSLALRLAGWPDDRPVWTGSCPCQDWSNAGRKAGFAGHRDLWPEMFRLIRERRPDCVLGEQVDDAPEWYDRTAHDLDRIGYACGAVEVPACAVGADHERMRLWFVAHAGGVRQQESRLHRQDASHHAAGAFGEADWLVDAVRRQALPYLCRRHDGLPASLGRIACKGFGNAIVPQVAAAFIEAADAVIGGAA